ncbi:hypothetical protein, partial [Chryseobacterium cucumeris]|uniref:hypothetical protein n=1 Tax=Chryseobacterium cucumeris TaxID=1813611 RepID=UPI0023F46FBE
MKKGIRIFFIFFASLLFSQESEGGRPLFYDYMNSGINGPVINIDESYITPADLLGKLKMINKWSILGNKHNFELLRNKTY